MTKSIRNAIIRTVASVVVSYLVKRLVDGLLADEESPA